MRMLNEMRAPEIEMDTLPNKHHTTAKILKISSATYAIYLSRRVYHDTTLESKSAIIPATALLDFRHI